MSGRRVWGEGDRGNEWPSTRHIRGQKGACEAPELAKIRRPPTAPTHFFRPPPQGETQRPNPPHVLAEPDTQSSLPCPPGIGIAPVRAAAAPRRNRRHHPRRSTRRCTLQRTATTHAHRYAHQIARGGGFAALRTDTPNPSQLERPPHPRPPDDDRWGVCQCSALVSARGKSRAVATAARCHSPASKDGVAWRSVSPPQPTMCVSHYAARCEDANPPGRRRGGVA